MVLCSVGTACAASQPALSTRALRTMSRAYMAFGRYDQARLLAQRAVAEANHSNVEIGEKALCLIDLATVYSYQQLLEDAAVNLNAGLALQQEALGAEHPYTAHTLRMLSDVYRRMDRLDAAEGTLAEAFSVMFAHTDIQNRQMIPFLIASAQLAAAQGRYEQAYQTYQSTRQMILDGYGPDHLYTAQVMQGAAEVALACGRVDEAHQQMTRSLELQTRFYGERSTMLVSGWLVQARIQRARGHRAAFEASLQKAGDVAQQSKNFITAARIYDQIGQIRNDSGLTRAARSL